MSRPTNRLSARFVQTLRAPTRPTYYCDGAGLYLLATPAGTASWVFRYTLRGRKREMGIGSAADFSLSQARERAAAQRRLLADGLDPIEARRGADVVADALPRTWAEARTEFIDAKAGEWRNTAQRAQWEQSLADYGPADKLPLSAITTEVAIACLQPEWRIGGKVETMTRVRGRCERIWDAERVRGNVAGENPFRWRGHLEHLLPRPGKIAKPEHHAAMPYADLPAFMALLASRSSRRRMALRFTILTAARTSEVIEAPWSEFDLEAGLWSIPAERMKAGRPHVVPLVPAAVAILRARRGEPMPFGLSIAAMLDLVQKPAPKGFGLPYTVHGMRSTFRDWVSEETDHSGEVAEMALAHRIEDETEAAYRRGALLAKRRRMMQDWSDFVHGASAGNVVALHGRGR